jgi:DNA-binding transcriptional regulator YiaG
VIRQEWDTRVVNLRLRLGISQEEFAKKLGISRATLQMWEHRRSRPYSIHAEYFERIEAALDDMTTEEQVKWLGPDEEGMEI